MPGNSYSGVSYYGAYPAAGSGSYAYGYSPSWMSTPQPVSDAYVKRSEMPNRASRPTVLDLPPMDSDFLASLMRRDSDTPVVSHRTKVKAPSNEEILSRRRQIQEDQSEKKGMGIKTALMVVPSLILGMGLIGYHMFRNHTREVKFVPADDTKVPKIKRVPEKTVVAGSDNSPAWTHFSDPALAAQATGMSLEQLKSMTTPKWENDSLVLKYDIPMYRQRDYKVADKPPGWFKALQADTSRPDHLKMGDVEMVPLYVIARKDSLTTVGPVDAEFMKDIQASVCNGLECQLSTQQFMSVLNEHVAERYSQVAGSIVAEIDEMSTRINRNETALIPDHASKVTRQIQTLNKGLQAQNAQMTQIHELSRQVPFVPDNLVEQWQFGADKLDDRFTKLRTQLHETSNACYNALSVEQNRGLKNLSLFLLIPTLTGMVASLYGMNVPLPGGNDSRTLPVVAFGVPLLAWGLTTLLGRKLNAPH